MLNRVFYQRPQKSRGFLADINYTKNSWVENQKV